MKHWQTKLSEKRMMHSLNLMNVSCLSAQELFKKTRKISQMKVPGPEMRKEGRRGRKKERKIRKRTGIDVMEIGYKRVFVCPDFIIFIIDVHKSTSLLTSAVVIHENFSHLNLFPCEGKTINYQGFEMLRYWEKTGCFWLREFYQNIFSIEERCRSEDQYFAD